MNNFDFHCTDCGCEFDQDFCSRGSPPVCPECDGENIISAELAEENRRINAQEAWAEGWQEE